MEPCGCSKLFLSSALIGFKINIQIVLCFREICLLKKIVQRLILYITAYIVVEETLRSTVNCIIVEVFLLKIVFHYVPFENQPDDPLKKLSIFLFELPDRFLRKFKIKKKKN